MERVSLCRGPAAVPETTLIVWVAAVCQTLSCVPGLRRSSSLCCGGHCLRGGDSVPVSVSAGCCPCRRLFPLQMAAAFLSTGSPSPCPGWRSSNNAEWRGWVTARCPTFSCYPGLRSGLSLASKSSSWHGTHMWMREVEPKGLLAQAGSVVGMSGGEQGSRSVVRASSLMPRR